MAFTPRRCKACPESVLASSAGQAVTYQFDAIPFGLHHVGPLAEHIAQGMYGTCLG